MAILSKRIFLLLLGSLLVFLSLSTSGSVAAQEETAAQVADAAAGSEEACTAEGGECVNPESVDASSEESATPETEAVSDVEEAEESVEASAASDVEATDATDETSESVDETPEPESTEEAVEAEEEVAAAVEEAIEESVDEEVVATSDAVEDVVAEVAEAVEDATPSEVVEEATTADVETPSTEEKKQQDSSCPDREHVVKCAAEYLDTNKNGLLEDSELSYAISHLPWYARGLMKILGSVRKMMKNCDVDGDGAISVDFDMENNKETCLATCFKRRAFKSAFFPDCDL